MDIFDTSKKKKIIFDAKKKDKKKQEKKELRKAVNELDKEFGCDLKHPKYEMDTEYEYSLLLDRVRYQLTTLLCKLHDVNPDKYISYNEIFGSSFKKIKLNKKFLKKSKFFNDTFYITTDPRFMIRFLSYILNWIIKHMENIINASFKINKDGKWIEYDQKIFYLETLLERVMDLFNNITDGNDVSYDIIYFYEIMLYVDNTKKKSIKKSYSLYDNTTKLDEMTKPFQIHKEGTIHSLVLESSYLVCTNDYKYKDFDEDTFLYTKNSMKDSIKNLGMQLRLSMKEKGCSKMFRYFLRAMPESPSYWENETSNDFKRGLYAIMFYAFLTGDRRIMRKIQKITGI